MDASLCTKNWIVDVSRGALGRTAAGANLTAGDPYYGELVGNVQIEYPLAGGGCAGGRHCHWCQLLGSDRSDRMFSLHWILEDIGIAKQV
jgi:hypothetical protein